MFVFLQQPQQTSASSSSSVPLNKQNQIRGEEDKKINLSFSAKIVIGKKMLLFLLLLRLNKRSFTKTEILIDISICLFGLPAFHQQKKKQHQQQIDRK